MVAAYPTWDELEEKNNVCEGQHGDELVLPVLKKK